MHVLLRILLVQYLQNIDYSILYVLYREGALVSGLEIQNAPDREPEVYI